MSFSDMSTVEIISSVATTLLLIAYGVFKKLFPEMLEALWRKFITSKHTFSRTSNSEKTLWIDGITRRMHLVKKRMAATRIILFQEVINGHNSLKIILDVSEGKPLELFNGVDTKNFQRSFKDFVENGYTSVDNTSDEERHLAFASFLKMQGVKAFDVYNIANSNCAFLIIYETHAISSPELQQFAQNTLSVCNDAIISLYSKK